ncbi:MAG: 16S rRNA (guanine(527)-N(7))-methyltransferase [Betaproteobacteria bacterium RBG_16_64_18]|nr:MAG: 16S rRNA (guanine(527)-N(7))-methyltransferase [Betaproteobacteria bacterium RBG_16_64_18]OGA09934.1 MAG: 16S rRNA (guanine(527)-N(7))-methyltransferase [Betaproteobacteria bacterium RIFCSPLOWO2_02_FULL_65_20]OGA42441.1 MAG: 16S rRNA (guanine(527)-N(7))-methyltransferase [Betaproteobacteria bacterium RIFCSPLOWO2_12_FULL_65_110]
MNTNTEQALTVSSELLEKGLLELRLPLGKDQQGLLLQYLVLLDKWNQVYNLTAIRDLTKMVEAHLLDSLSAVPLLAGESVLDVGSGAGLPGIPIAVAKPGWEVTLLDSNHKKAAFLRQAVAELALKNANVVCERVESWVAPKKFEVIISRAFSDLGEFVSLAGGLLAPGGVIAAMKGLHPFEELERLPSGFRVKEVRGLQVPGLGAERHLVLIERA